MARNSASSPTHETARTNPAAHPNTDSITTYLKHVGQSKPVSQRAGARREAQKSSAGGRDRATTPGWPLTLPHHTGKVTSQHELRQQALYTYSAIGAQFNEAYEQSVTQAMRGLLIALRANQRLLVEGGLYTARELDDRVEQLQEHLKVGGDEGKTTMEDRFHQWLNEIETND
jgi:hypothetical protein